MVCNSTFQAYWGGTLGVFSTLWAICVVTVPTLLAEQAIAQVEPDATLTTPSIVSLNDTTYAINGGSTNGANLFHSFATFSLSTGEIAQFNNDLAIENIITRVTGDALSHINGTIKAQGTANLFLLNPNGITFGSNAELNIGGSFLGTTADRFLFDDNSEFSAVNPQDPPLLAINTPLGLQFGSTSAPIRVNGPGNGLFNDLDTFNVVRSDRPPGVAVNDGETLALVGGRLIFEGGNITASQGRIELGSVGNDNTVLLDMVNDQWTLNYDQVDTFRTIQLTESASVDTSGDGAGSIQVYGKSLRATDGSALLALTLGNSNSGTVNVQITEAIELEGTSVDTEGLTLLASGIITEVSLNATGNGATTIINAPQLRLSGGSQVSATTFGEGNGGNVDVTAQTIVLDGLSEDESFASGLFSITDIDARGQGGTLTLNTDHLLLTGESEISTRTFGTGNAGDIRIIANRIEATEGSRIAAASEPGSFGNGGDIVLNTTHLQLSDDGQVSAGAFSSGNGGTLTIFAQKIELLGGSGTGTLLATDVGEDGSGNGGTLSIQAESILVAGGAQLLAATAGAGAAGELIIEAQTIELQGGNSSVRSGIVASAVIGDGDGGNVEVTADQLTIEDGATITVGNFGTSASIPSGSGDSGSIFIDADIIQLENEGFITASSLNGLGDIAIDSTLILMSRRSNITTNAFGSAPGGNITINTGTLSGIGNSDITATADNDRGGRILITADNVFGFQVSNVTNPTAAATNDITASSQLGTEFSGVVQLNTPDTDSAQLVTRLSDDVVDPSNLVGSVCALDQGQNTLVVAGRGGLPVDPTQVFDSAHPWVDVRLAEEGNNLGEIPDQSHREAIAPYSPSSTPSIFHFSAPPSSVLIEATEWSIDPSGQVVLTAAQKSESSLEPSACG